MRLRYTKLGSASGQAFFGPLGERTNEILDQFTSDQLATILRLVGAVAESMHSTWRIWRAAACSVQRQENLGSVRDKALFRTDAGFSLTAPGL